MTIVQAIETSGPGGAEQVLIRLSLALRDAGHDVRPLLLRRGWLSDRLEEAGFEVTILPLAGPVDLGFPRGLAAFLRSVGADVLHSHEFTFALYGRLAAARAGVAHVATAHGRNFSGRLKRRATGALAFRGGRRFRLAAVSVFLAERLSIDFLMGCERIAVVHNGIDVPPESTVRSRAPGDPLSVVVVGNLYPVKNHALLIRAAARLRDEGVRVEIDILGRGAEEETLRSLAASLHVDDRLRLRGFSEDVPAFLARAHVFASSSLSEAMPLSVLEAMAHGLPVVASRVGGIPEIVEDGVHGLLFASGDEAGVAAALRRMASEEPFRRACGARAAEAARARFGSDRMVRRYVGIYDELRAA